MKVMETPKIRPLEAFPVEQDGKPAICVRDPQGLAAGFAFVPPPVYFLMTLMDGSRTILEIQEAFVRQVGQLVTSDQIRQIINQLDEGYFLESDRFQSHLETVVEEFRRAPHRASSHAGQAYPDDRAELEKILDACLDGTGGESETQTEPDRPLRGLVAPHIDFARGGKTYGVAYRTLAGSPDADLYVILGVGHHLRDSLYAVTGKDFETPFGTMKTDGEFVRRLSESAGDGILAEEFAHKSEHSIEFQVLFLQRILPDWESKRIVPVLCGSFHGFLLTGTDPGDSDDIRRFTEGLRDLLEAYNGSWCVIAGVDLAHIGAHFGDSERLDDGFLARTRGADEIMLEKFRQGDARGFYESIREDNDARRVCGGLAMYTLLETVHPRRTELLAYEQCVDQDSQTCVTIGAAAVYE
jgi:AmmeMemoRadiSam system protein B